MKKIISILLAVLLLASLGTAAFADGEEVWTFEEIGVTMKAPADFEDLNGVLYPYPFGNIARNPDVYYMPFYYFAMSEDAFIAVMEKEELTDEEIADFHSKQLELGDVLVGNAELAALAQVLGATEADFADATLLGEADGFFFYYLSYYLPGEASEIDTLEEPYATEAAKINSALPELLKAAELYAPVDPMAGIVGKTVSFEAVDLDGNAVTSAELFADNEVTMINYWGTWCHNCVDEMAELAEIHTRLQEKGCGVIGILQDGDTDEGLALAKQIMADKGTNYPNVLQDDSMAFLDDVNSFPTTFFVDSEGNILCYPIVGAAVNRYEETVDSLLAGDSVDGFTEVGAGANDENVFRVITVDSEGAPVKGTAIQFCDDTTCNIGKTDENGVASFDLPEGTPYIVHVLKVPEGFEKDNGEYHTLDVYSDVVIVLNRAA